VADQLTFQCASCGEVHTGLFDLACHRPDQWQDDDEYGPNSFALSSSHFLSEDFCVLHGEHFFVRCLLELPIVGRPGERFAFGVWSTLSEANFRTYIEAFDVGMDDDAGPWFGWLSNRLVGYPDTLNQKCDVFPRAGRLRPVVRLQDEQHPLAQEAEKGITLERLLEIYRAYGHEVSFAAIGTH
jgi:hypothetical protein